MQDDISLGIRPSRLIVEKDHSPQCGKPDAANCFPGQIVQTIPTPDGHLVFIQLVGDRAFLSDHALVGLKQPVYDLQAYVPMDFRNSDHQLLQFGERCQVTFPISAMALWPQGIK